LSTCLSSFSNFLHLTVSEDAGNEDDMPPLEEGGDEDSSKMEEVD
jgi:hypothetical protein